MSYYQSSLSQQQKIYQQQQLANYNTVFNEKLVPPDLTDQSYIFGNNIKFTNSLDRVSNDLILIDSNFRNWDQQEPNDYIAVLNKEYKYVHSLELIDGYVPNSGYMITIHNNVLHIEETSGCLLMAIVPPGNYQIMDLLNILQSEINFLPGVKNKYRFNRDLNTNKITVSCLGTPFNLIFTDGDDVYGDRGYIESLEIDPITGKTISVKKVVSEKKNRYVARTIGSTLGFKAINLCGQTHYKAQMIYKLRPYNYLALFVNTEKKDDFSLIEAPNSHVDGSFAIVPLHQNSEEFMISTQHIQVKDYARYIKTFNPPINLNKLVIRFETIDGKTYDFNGMNHWLLFSVKRVYDREIIDKLDQLK